jgi:hypothetical protein
MKLVTFQRSSGGPVTVNADQIVYFEEYTQTETRIQFGFSHGEKNARHYLVVAHIPRDVTALIERAHNI